MQRNFGIKPSPAKFLGIGAGLLWLGTKAAGLIAGKVGATALTTAATKAGGALTAKATAGVLGKAALGVAKAKAVPAIGSAIVGTGASKLLSGGSKKQYVQAPNKTAGMKPIMEEKERS